MKKRYSILATLLSFTILLAGCGLIGFEEEKERPERLNVADWPTPVPETARPTATPFPKTRLNSTAASVSSSSEAPAVSTQTEGSLDLSGNPTELVEQVQTLTGGLNPIGAAFITSDGSTIRQGPGESFEILDTLDQGEATAALGQNAAGDWLYVITTALVQGWLPLDDVRLSGDLAKAPVLPDAQADADANPAAPSSVPADALADLANVRLNALSEFAPVGAAFVVAGGSTVHRGPAASAGVIETLEPGEVLGVLGKNPAGDWLYVISVDLAQGWMPLQSLRVVGALDEAPVLPPDPVAAALARVTSSSSDGQAGGTPSQTIEVAELEPVTTARVSNAALNLRQRPGGQYTLLTTLSQDDEVTVLALNRDKQWGLVETADGRLGWGSIELMDVTGSLANAPQVRTLSPDENYPADQAAPIVALSASASAAPVSGTAGNVSPAPAAVAAVGVPARPSPPGNSLAQLGTARVAEKVDMLRGPGNSFGPVAALTVDEPVSIRGVNEARDWVVVTATNGRAGWVPLATLALDGPLAEAPPVLTAWVQSNDLDIKTGPGIFYENAGKLAINNLVSIIALNEGRSWALVETLPGGQGWIPLRFLTISGSLANTPQFDPASVASSTSAEPDVPLPSGPPTGRLVFQTSSGGDIMLINADGTGLRRLTNGIDPVLSPDGQKVAFTRWEGDTGTLWEINVDGTGERPILGEMRQAKGPDWSPDGSQIVLNFQHGGRLEEKVSCVGLSGGRPNVPRNATNIRLSFGGRIPELCYDLPPDPQWGLRVVDVTDGSFEDIFGGFYAFRPTWDPDQSWRVVSDSGAGLLAVDVNRADFRQPLSDKVEDGAPVFSPDGRFIALVTDVQGGHDIFRMNRDGSGRVRLTQTPLWVPVQPDSDGSQWNNVSPAWSADSSRIAFLTDRSGRWEIWQMNADGSDQRPMYSEEINDQLDISYQFVDERVLSWR